MNLYIYHNTPEELKWFETVSPVIKQLEVDSFWNQIGYPEYTG